ncbi:hypothetical protein KY290_019180 [Solanum tuberosum]|uniref:Uncharacterized protein n=1 Tax=Solanum tuberosum TaxID=4113 RepID=A0ABQ7VGB0_SOLTU|nr:hypothetical protein KY284_018126 [Solanum tuberosum]KAH0703854.1 hypothetical protein KY285_018132 [Solanum tuberosum]KAH0763107.1 hypothetical protein KY290_019180 [Solanum tuberosum]
MAAKNGDGVQLELVWWLRLLVLWRLDEERKMVMMCAGDEGGRNKSGFVDKNCDNVNNLATETVGMGENVIGFT